MATWDKLVGTPTLPNVGRKVAFSPDESLMAVTHNNSPFLSIYNTSDWSTVAGTPTLAGIGFGVEFSNDGTKLAVGHASGNRVSVFNVSDWSSITVPSLPGNCFGIEFLPDDSQLLMGHSGSPYFSVFETSGWTTVAGTPTLPNFVTDLSINNDGSNVAITHGGTPFLTVLDTSDWSTVAGTPTLLTTGNAVAYSKDGSKLVTNPNSGGFGSVYETSGWTVDQALADYSGTQNSNWSVDDLYLAAASGPGNFGITVFETTTWSTVLTDLSALQGSGVRFSSSNNFLGVAYFTSPYIAVYEGPGTLSGGDYLSTTTVVSTITPNLNVTRPLVATTNVVSTLVAHLAGPVRFVSTTDAASIVTGNIDETRKLLGTTAVTSVLGPTPSLDAGRNYVTAVAASSNVTASLLVSPTLGTTVAVTSTITSNLNSTRILTSATNVVSAVTPAIALEKVLASTTTAVSTVSNFLSALPFPTVTQRITGTSTASLGTHVITLPDHEAGDRIVIFLAHGGWPWPDLAPESVTHGWRNMWWQDSGGGANIATIIATGSNSETGTLIFEPEPFGVPVGTAYVGLTIQNANNIAIQSSLWPADGGLEYGAYPSSFANLDITNEKPALWIAASGGTTNYLQNWQGAGPADDWSMKSSLPTSYSNLTTVASGIDLPFQSTVERLLLASSEKPSDYNPEGPNGDWPVYQNWTVAIWSDERNESSHAWSFGDRIAAFTETTVADIEGWVHNEVVTSGSANDAPNFANTYPTQLDGAYFTTGHYLVEAGTGAGTLDSYTEWSGTFEDLDVPAGSRILGYTNASFHYLFPVYGANVIAAYIGDDLASNGAFYVNDGTIRTLIPDIADPTTTKTVTRVENDPAITGLNLASDTAITLRINTHGETAASSSLYTIGIDEISITMEILPPVQFQTTVAATSTISGVFDRQPLFASTTNVVSVVDPNEFDHAIFFDTQIAMSSNIVGTRANFPYVSDSVDSDSGVQSGSPKTVAVTMPTHIIGDLIFVAVQVSSTYDVSGQAVVNAANSTDDWKLQEVHPNVITEIGGNQVLARHGYWKIAESTSETLELDVDANTNTGHSANIIKNSNGLIRTGSYITSVNNRNFMDLELRHARDYMWIALGALHGSETGWINGAGGAFQTKNLNVQHLQPSVGGDTTNTCNVVFVVYPFDDFDAEQKVSFFSDWHKLTESGDEKDGWEITKGDVSTTALLDGVRTGVQGSQGALLLSVDAGVDEQGYIGKSGTFEDFGVPAGKKIRGYRTYTYAETINDSPPTGTFQTKLEAIEDSTPRTLIALSDVVGGGTGWGSNTQSISNNWYKPSTPSSTTVTAPLLESDSTVEFRLSWELDNTGGTSLIWRADFVVIEILFSTERLFASTTTTTSTVTTSFNRTVPLISTTNAVSTVAGNIDATRKLLTTTVAQSALVLPTNLEVARPIASTTDVASTVAANLGLTVFFNSDTDVVSTVDPNQFYYGFETSITVQSAVTCSLEVDRSMMSATVSQSAVVTPNLERTVDWDSTTSVATALFGNIERDVPFIADVNAFSQHTGLLRLAGKFETVINVQSTVDPTELERVRGYAANVDVVSESHGNIVQGLRFISTTVAESAVINADLVRLVNWATSFTVTTAATANVVRDIEWAVVIPAQSTTSATIVVITNTLELTLSETYFIEIEDRVLQLVTTSVDDVAVINEVIPDVNVGIVDELEDALIPITTDN